MKLLKPNICDEEGYKSYEYLSKQRERDLTVIVGVGLILTAAVIVGVVLHLERPVMDAITRSLALR